MLRCKTMYSNNPAKLETVHVIDSEGNRVVTAIKSRYDKMECEKFYVYIEGKPHLERKTERRGNVVRDYIFPKNSKGKVKITDTCYRDGHELYTCNLNERCEPLFTVWHDTNEVVLA